MGCRKFVIIFACLLAFIFVSTIVYAAMSPEEKSFLSMYFTDQELQVISATRSLQSINRVAENMEVVTAKDIELMNAHTLADVLNTVNGVQVWFAGASPGSPANVLIEGSDIKHVAVFMDGVPMNYLATNGSAVNDIPVQNIEKIEIIKGPASSSWGSSLGGVINIITKTPGKEKADGTLSASYGKKDTGDFRGEVYGKIKDFGYYLNAGRLQTDGLRPMQDGANDNVYAKLSYDLSNVTQVLFTLAYMKGNRGEGDWGDGVNYNDKFEDLISSLSLHSSLSKEVALDLSLWTVRLRQNNFADDVSLVHLDDRKYGATAKMVWSHEIHTVVIGTDYNDGSSKYNFYSLGEKKLRTEAVYVNDTIVLGKLSIIPGMRYDDSNLFRSFTSPSLGATYELTKDVLLRAYVARGFSLPALDQTDSIDPTFIPNPDLRPERVWSYQAGVETGILKYVWLKVSGFRHDIKDAINNIPLDSANSTWTNVNLNKERRQGIEVEMKTVPVYNFVLSAGATFMHTENPDTGQTVKGVPTYTYDIGLKYDDKKSFRALLKGRYVWWNLEPFWNAKYSSMIFDLNLIKDVCRSRGNITEVFVAGHNIFDGRQYVFPVYENASRWIEAGVRYRF